MAGSCLLCPVALPGTQKEGAGGGGSGGAVGTDGPSALGQGPAPGLLGVRVGPVPGLTQQNCRACQRLQRPVRTIPRANCDIWAILDTAQGQQERLRGLRPPGQGRLPEFPIVIWGADSQGAPHRWVSWHLPDVRDGGGPVGTSGGDWGPAGLTGSQEQRLEEPDVPHPSPTPRRAAWAAGGVWDGRGAPAWAVLLGQLAPPETGGPSGRAEPR